MSQFTHKGLYAWDFILPPETPIASVKPGRVIFLVDNSTATGSNDYALSNMIWVDHGGNRFTTYLHHRAHTALVRLGEIVSTGTKLAEVGSSGTIISHLHFDLRGSSWHTSHSVRFVGRQNQLMEVVQGESYLSATPEPIPTDTESFTDSALGGEEFLANGIRLQTGLQSYSLPVETEIIFRGTVLKKPEFVFFYLWRMGKRGPSLSVHEPVGRNGEFELRVCIPGQFTGCCFYKISARVRSGPALLPVWVH